MTGHIINASQQRIARVAGIGYLIIIVAGIFAEFAVRSRLIVSGDPAATASNILGSESLFRISMASDMLMIGADLVVAVALYVLLSPINRPLALTAAFFRLVMDSILGINLLNLLAALMLFKSSGDLAAFETDQLHAAAMSFLDAHALGYSIGLIPFGLGTLVIGYLLFTSKYVPTAVAVLVSLASVVYLTGSFAHILTPNFYEESFQPAFLLPFVAELALALWLSLKGVRVEASQPRRVPAVAS